MTTQDDEDNSSNDEEASEDKDKRNHSPNCKKMLPLLAQLLPLLSYCAFYVPGGPLHNVSTSFRNKLVEYTISLLKLTAVL